MKPREMTGNLTAATASTNNENSTNSLSGSPADSLAWQMPLSHTDDNQSLHIDTNAAATSSASLSEVRSPVATTSLPPPSKRVNAPGIKSKLEDDVAAELLQSIRESEKEPDDDESFFKSCLPMVKELTNSEKLEFRINVQQLLLRFQRRKDSRAATTMTRPPQEEYYTTDTTSTCYSGGSGTNYYQDCYHENDYNN